MKGKSCYWLMLFVIPFSLFADDSFYCPTNSQYVQPGMTMDQVLSACGEPTTRAESNQVLNDKVPVEQLTFNNVGSDTAFYGVWNMQTGERGSQLQIDIIDDKVASIKINGSDTRAFDLCNETSIQVGDPSSLVFNNCDTPNITNHTYILKPHPLKQKPIAWFYNFGDYQPSATLTFVDGKLQSIDH